MPSPPAPAQRASRMWQCTVLRTWAPWLVEQVPAKDGGVVLECQACERADAADHAPDVQLVQRPCGRVPVEVQDVLARCNMQPVGSGPGTCVNKRSCWSATPPMLLHTNMCELFTNAAVAVVAWCNA